MTILILFVSLLGSSILVSIPTSSAQEQQQIPNWIKNVSGWWANNEISEKEFLDAMKFAHNPIKDIIDLQNKLCEQLDIAKREVPSDNVNEDLKESVLKSVISKIDQAIKIGDKSERQEAISNLHAEAQQDFIEANPESEKEIKSFIDEALKSAFREQILSDSISVFR